MSPAAIRIHRPKNLYSKLQLINAGLVQLLVSFNGRGENLLEKNERLGHNLRQYGIITLGTLVILGIYHNIIICQCLV